MTTAIVFQTLVTIAALQNVFSPHPQEVVFLPQKHEVLAAVVSPSLTPTATPTPSFIDYTTKNGDTLARISREQYGSEKFWTSVWNDNPELTDPAIIHPGLMLKIRTSQPEDVEELTRVLPTATPTPQPEITEVPSPTSSPQATQVGSPTGNFSQTYSDAGSKYGVPWQVLYAIHMVETGLRDGPIGSGEGPQGPMQFVPGTWAAYGVDGNGDGTADINNAVDAIHSAANYLSKHGTIEQGLDSYGKIKEDVFNIARQQGYTP